MPSPRGLSARWSSAGRSCESWRCCSASVGTRQPRSSSPRPGSRSSSRSEKLTPRSRWASSSPEKDDGSYGRTTTASMEHQTALTMRQPLGVAGLVMSFNIRCQKSRGRRFPRSCGNAVVVKPSAEVPSSAFFFVELAHEAVPAGVLNVVQGLGAEARAALVEHEDVDLVSFTGSAATGRWINETAGRRLAKICLELEARTRSSSATMPISAPVPRLEPPTRRARS